MSLSDCEKCWSTPCQCGYRYKNYSLSSFLGHIKDIISGYFKYRNEDKNVPDNKIDSDKEEFFNQMEIYLKSKSNNENKN